MIKKSNELLTKAKMLHELVLFYPKSKRDYLYNDFYKLTNFSIKLLLDDRKEIIKVLEEIRKQGALKELEKILEKYDGVMLEVIKTYIINRIKELGEKTNG